MIETKILGAAVGAQVGDVIDNTESTSLPSTSDGVVVGKFKRGRTDKPFLVTPTTYQGLLGRDARNPSYNVIEDALNRGLSGVWVQRIGSSDASGGGLAEWNYKYLLYDPPSGSQLQSSASTLVKGDTLTLKEYDAQTYLINSWAAVATIKVGQTLRLHVPDWSNLPESPSWSLEVRGIANDNTWEAEDGSMLDYILVKDFLHISNQDAGQGKLSTAEGITMTEPYQAGEFIDVTFADSGEVVAKYPERWKYSYADFNRLVQGRKFDVSQLNAVQVNIYNLPSIKVEIIS